MSSINDPNNIRVPPVNRDDGTSSIRQRQNVAGRKDFRKILDNDDEKDPEQDVSDVALPVDSKTASVDKPKRPSILSLAGQHDAGSVAMNVGSGKWSTVNAPEDKIVTSDDDSSEEEAALAAALLAFAKEVARGASEDAGSIIQSNPPAKKNQEIDVRTLQTLLGQQGDTSVKDSPFALYRNLKGKDSTRASSDGEADTVLTRKDTARFGQEQPDLSYVNIMQGPASIQSAAATVKPTSRAPYIQEIISQMVDRLSVMESSGKTETTITIKNHPLFEGAQLTITGFDSAVREFNVSFQNLSPSAKQLLDLNTNQTDLKMAMAEKGFTVHIIVTTTETEHRGFGDREGEQRFGQNRQNQEDEQQG